MPPSPARQPNRDLRDNLSHPAREPLSKQAHSSQSSLTTPQGRAISRNRLVENSLFMDFSTPPSPPVTPGKSSPPPVSSSNARLKSTVTSTRSVTSAASATPTSAKNSSPSVSKSASRTSREISRSKPQTHRSLPPRKRKPRHSVTEPRQQLLKLKTREGRRSARNRAARVSKRFRALVTVTLRSPFQPRL